MKKAVLLFMIISAAVLMCSCSGGEKGGSSLPDRSEPSESVLHIEGANDIDYTVISSEKGYRIGYDAEHFEYVSGTTDVFSSQSSGSSLEISLSGGKTVDKSADEYISALKSDGYTVTSPESIAVGTEFYSSRHFTAEKSGEREECYFIPVENECLIMIFDINTAVDDSQSDILLGMLETLTIN